MGLHQKKYLQEKYDLDNKTYWSLTWRYHKTRSRVREKNKPSYYGVPTGITLEEICFLWNRDKAYLLDKPTIDRIIPKKGYVFDNCRFIEAFDNYSRADRTNSIKRLSKPVQKFSISGELLSTFQSAHEAARQTGCKRVKISEVCGGVRKKTGGYIWKFKEG